MSTWQERLIEENKELNEKAAVLRVFMRTEEFNNLPDSLKSCYMSQLMHMNSYSTCLEMRIAIQIESK